MAAKRLPAAFYRSASGSEPVREWLKDRSHEDRITIGQDIAKVEFLWPVGMPTVRAIAGRPGLMEVRTNLSGGRIARVFFCIHGGRMVLLHGLLKTSQKTPPRELDVAEARQKGLMK